MYMEWYILSIYLALTYTSYIVLSQYLMNTFDLQPRTVFVNVICIAALLSLYIYPQEFHIPRFNKQYGLLFLIGVTLFFSNYLAQIGTKMTFNMGIIEGLAICMYFPLVTLLLYVWFGEVISIKKKFGILLACIAGYFILT